MQKNDDYINKKTSFYIVKEVLDCNQFICARMDYYFKEKNHSSGNIIYDSSL
jgi:hypothetical protein